jgi:hypothetical protein
VGITTAMAHNGMCVGTATETSRRQRISTTMTHIAIAEMLDGKAVEWMEQVTDEQYVA